MAFVEVPLVNSRIELIAHELEHVIEQLDEADLAAVASRRNSGVKKLVGGVFETVRASRIGLTVAAEVR
jgi:hypothetical protein